MLLQTNSYIVPKEKRSEHARLMRRFRQVLGKLGCDMFETYEQVGANWNGSDASGRFVQIMRFRDRKHQMSVQNAEKNDPVAQALIAEFCALVNFQYQQQQGYFAVGFYNGVLPGTSMPVEPAAGDEDFVEDDGGIPIEEATAVAGAGLADDLTAGERSNDSESGHDDIAPEMIDGEVTEVLSDTPVHALPESPHPGTPLQVGGTPEVEAEELHEFESFADETADPQPVSEAHESHGDSESADGEMLEVFEGYDHESEVASSAPHANASNLAIHHAPTGDAARTPLSEDELMGELYETEGESAEAGHSPADAAHPAAPMQAGHATGEPPAAETLDADFELMEPFPDDLGEHVEALEVDDGQPEASPLAALDSPEHSEPTEASEMPVTPSVEATERPSLFQRFRRG